MSVKHALVVDDSKSAGLALRRLLEQTKVAVDMAESAEAALEYLKGAKKPDVIFMDHIMPGMNGFEAAKAITSNPNTNAIPIIMYTSKDDAGYLESARAHGAVGILPKPPKAETLNVVLTTLAGGGIPAAPAKAPAAAAAAPAAGIDQGALKGLLDELRKEIAAKIEQVARETASDVFRTRGTELSHSIRKQVEEQMSELAGRATTKAQGLSPAEKEELKAVAAEAGAHSAVESAKKIAHDVAMHAAQDTAKKVATDTAKQIATEAARHAAEQQYQISMGGLAEKLMAQVKPEIEDIRAHMRDHKLDANVVAEIQKVATAAAQQRATEAAQRAARETALSVSQQAAGQMVDEAIDQLKRDLDKALDPQLRGAKLYGYIGIAMAVVAIALVFVFR